MSVEEIWKEIIRISKESMKSKESVKIEILMGKSDVFYAYAIGSPLVDDEIIGMFDSFTGFESLRMVIYFDGLGDARQEVFAVKG